MVAILGAGGHGQDVAHILPHPDSVRFHDDDPVLGLPACSEAIGPYLIGVYDPHARRDLDITDTQHTYASIAVHRCTSFDEPPRVGAGVVLAAGVRVGVQVSLGRHVHVGANTSITRATVGDYTTVAPGVTICGDVTIGDRCLIGAGAVISNLCIIGNDVTLGAGAVVPPRTTIPDGQTWVGVPAQGVRKA
jgi:acetyltransferase-like isoleucine patch superfamily enzyme